MVKINIDKSKLSESYFTNFDQFIIATTVDDPTKRASTNKNIENPFDIVVPTEENDPASNSIKQSKEEAMKKQLERRSVIEQQRSKVALQAKERAMRKEKDRGAKQKCAIKIQKVWKGHVQKRDFRIIIENLRMIKKLRGIFEH